jgi:hypothetical protein
LDSHYASPQKKVLQAIQVLREGQMEMKGKSIPVVLIEQPVLFPGCGWTRKSIKIVDFTETKEKYILICF